MLMWIFCGLAAAIIFYSWLEKPLDEIDWLITFGAFVFGLLSLLVLMGIWLYSRI